MWRRSIALGLLGRLPRRSSPRSAVASIAAAATLAACFKWSGTAENYPEVVARRPEVLRIHVHDRSALTLYGASIVGDSLTGNTVAYDFSSRTAVALADVTRVEVRRLDAVATLIGIGATALLIAEVTKDRPPETRSTSTSDDWGQSCPFVYAWDGTAWRLSSGTFSGAIARPLKRTVVDNLDRVAAESGVVRLRITDELDETEHVDALAVLAVDHAPGTAVVPGAMGELHTVTAPQAPVSAADFRGADALARVRDADGWGWESSFAGRDPTRAGDLRDGLLLAFVRPPGALHAHLVIDAVNTPWAVYLLNQFIAAHGAGTDAYYDSLNTRPAVAQALAARLAAEGFLAVALKTHAGWSPAGLVQEVGPELARRQALVLDLSAVEGDTVLVRLESAPALWLVDRVAMDFGADAPIVVHELPLLSARDAAGRDVARLIESADGLDYVMEPGDTAEAAFGTREPAPGLERSYLVRAAGWYQIHVRSAGAPNVALIGAVLRDTMGVSKTDVAAINAALTAR
jgi:hypothetical protein